MEKLELKHIAPYLPYGLMVTLKSDIFNNDGCAIKLGTQILYGWNRGLTDIIPILRPLSQLTQEIEHNGERFVPIIELAKIATLSVGGKKWELDINNIRAVHESGAQFYWSSGSFVYKHSDKWGDFGVPSQQLLLFEKLFEWHFDVFGLIEKGLAIEKK